MQPQPLNPAKKKILIIDDEPSFCRMIKRNLEKTNDYAVEIEIKGKQGIVKAAKFRPDLILLDIVMPDLGGHEVAWQVKYDPRVKDIPIIFLSGVLSEQRPSDFIGLVDGWPVLAQPALSKPVSTSALVQNIEKHVMKREVYKQTKVCEKCNETIDYLNDATIHFGEKNEWELLEQYLAGDKTIIKAAHLVHLDCARTLRINRLL